LSNGFSASRPRPLASGRAKRGGRRSVAGMARAGAAVLAHRQARRAGRNCRRCFPTASRTWPHYGERVARCPIDFLRGPRAMLENLLKSGVIDQAAPQYWAVAIKWRGCGRRHRPFGNDWHASAQASVLFHAFKRLATDCRIVVGQSALVAPALALDHPRAGSGLVLIPRYCDPHMSRGGSQRVHHTKPRRVDRIASEPPAWPRPRV
jgi:hypothetical protein